MWSDNLVPAMTAHLVHDVHALTVTEGAVRAAKRVSALSDATRS